MPLETTNTINGLDPSNPIGSDPIASADDHIRLLKTVLKATFPNITAPITATQDYLNTRGVPSGFIGMWSGLIASIPTGWLICDGTNGTPNLMDRFIVGAGLNYAVGAQGGAINAASTPAGSHTHTTDSQGVHTHTGKAASHVLTVDEIPSHKHQSWGESFGGEFGTSVEKGHQGSGQSDSDNYLFNTSAVGGGQGHVHDVTIDPSVGHTHGVSTAADHTHTTDTRSPYFALCFIQKV